MTPKRGDAVAPPPRPGEYEVRYACSAAVEGWQHLCKQAAGNTRKAWEEMCTAPAPQPETRRHHHLKHEYATGVHRGRELPQWQIEVTGGGRIWYLFDEKQRVCWVSLAGTGHPWQTD